jgi:hypothetical protein
MAAPPQHLSEGLLDSLLADYDDDLDDADADEMPDAVAFGGGDSSSVASVLAASSSSSSSSSTSPTAAVSFSADADGSAASNPLLRIFGANASSSSSTSSSSSAPSQSQSKSAAKPRSRAHSAYDRLNALLRHKLHVRCLLVRLAQRSALCDDAELRATLLSCLPRELALAPQLSGGGGGGGDTASAADAGTSSVTSSAVDLPFLASLVAWFRRHLPPLDTMAAAANADLVVSCAALPQRVHACGVRQLLEVWRDRFAATTAASSSSSSLSLSSSSSPSSVAASVSGFESDPPPPTPLVCGAEHAALLGVALLRAAGVPTRLVTALRPLPPACAPQEQRAAEAGAALRAASLLRYSTR